MKILNFQQPIFGYTNIYYNIGIGETLVAVIICFLVLHDTINSDEQTAVASVPNVRSHNNLLFSSVLKIVKRI